MLKNGVILKKIHGNKSLIIFLFNNYNVIETFDSFIIDARLLAKNFLILLIKC